MPLALARTELRVHGTGKSPFDIERIEHLQSRQADETGIVGPELDRPRFEGGQTDLQVEDPRSADTELFGRLQTPRYEV